jgi:hypothetical protein
MVVEMKSSKKSTTVTVEKSIWNGCSVDTRIIDPKIRRLTRRLVIEMVDATQNQNKVARKLGINSGLVNWFIVEEDKLHGHDKKETDRLRWTHITLTPLFVERIKWTHSEIVDGFEFDGDLAEHVNHALGLETELSKELRYIRNAIKRR